MRHKDPYKGYILCGVVSTSRFLIVIKLIHWLSPGGCSTFRVVIGRALNCRAPCRTVVHNVLVGSVSFAQSGAKALHNASTASEITIIAPNATNFELRVRFPNFVAHLLKLG